MEEWKQINDYPNYSISSLGQVRRNDKIRKLSLGRGYLRIGLYKNGIKKHYFIHRLVGIHFLPNWNNLKDIDHKNRDKLDNRVFNLRWCSRSDNCINKPKRQNTSSKFVGVSFDKSSNKWFAQIRRNNRNKHIGSFNTELEAYNSWKKYVLENHLEKFYEDKI